MSDADKLKVLIAEAMHTHQAECPVLKLINEKFQTLEHRLETIENKLDAQHQHLYVGNGSPPVLSRLSRLEDDRDRARSWQILVVSALAVVLIESAWSWLSSRGGKTPQSIHQVEK